MKYKVKLPSTTENIKERYLSLLKMNEGYPAYSIDDNLDLIEGTGTIEMNDDYNYHCNTDESIPELYFAYEAYPTHNHLTKEKRWWTISISDAVELRESLIRLNIEDLEQEITTLEAKL